MAWMKLSGPKNFGELTVHAIIKPVVSMASLKKEYLA
jgi:hypothetical protein